MPLGSSSDAPVTSPGPRRPRNPFLGVAHARCSERSRSMVVSRFASKHSPLLVERVGCRYRGESLNGVPEGCLPAWSGKSDDALQLVDAVRRLIANPDA